MAELVDLRDSTLLLPVLENQLVSHSPELIRRVEAELQDLDIELVIDLFKRPLAAQFAPQAVETLIARLEALPESERAELKGEIAEISLRSFYSTLVSRFVEWLQQSVSDAQLLFFADMLPLCVEFLQPLRELLESDAYWERLLTGSLANDFVLEAISDVDLVLEPCLHLQPVSHIIRFALFQTFDMFAPDSL